MTNEKNDLLLKKHGYVAVNFRVSLLDYCGNIGRYVSDRVGYVKKEEYKPNHIYRTNEHYFNRNYSKFAVLKKIKEL